MADATKVCLFVSLTQKKPLQPLYFAVRLEAATTALKAAVEKVQPEASAWASSRLRSCGRVQTKLVESSGMVS